MARYEDKEGRLHLICKEKYKEKVLENIKKYPFFKLVGTYLDYVNKEFNWCNIIVDSVDFTLNEEFGLKFNKEVGMNLAIFSNYYSFLE